MLISFDAMKETVEVYFKMIKAFELNCIYKNVIMFCEPNMGKRNLYEDLSGAMVMPEELITRMRLINYMDGENTLLSFSEKYNLNILDLKKEIDLLMNKGVLER